MPEASFRADLHCHTTASDGSDTPEELVRLARQLPLQGLAITDHDTIAGIARALPVAKALDLPLLSGLELSTLFEGESIHLLAYGFSLESESIHALVREQQQARNCRNEAILKKLKNLGFSLEESDLEGGETIGRPHIALALMKKGVIGSVEEGFHKYLGEGKSAYVPGYRIDLVSAIRKVQEGGGKAILAHPHLIVRKKILRNVLGLPFDGIEVYYALMPKEREAPFARIAEEKGWLMTGGSDYHGKIKPHIPLGASWVDEKTFWRLYGNH